MLTDFEREWLERRRAEYEERIETLRRIYAMLTADYGITGDEDIMAKADQVDAEIKRLTDEVFAIESELGWDAWAA